MGYYFGHYGEYKKIHAQIYSHWRNKSYKHEIIRDKIMYYGVLNCEIQIIHFEKQKKRVISKCVLELQWFWWLTPRKWFHNGKRHVIAQLVKEISRNTKGSVVNILYIFFFFCLSACLVFLPSLSLLLSFFLPAFPFLVSLSFCLVYDQIWKWWLRELESWTWNLGKYF